MATVTLLICDECASQEDVKHYEVRQDSRKGTVDLCKLHNKPLEQMLPDKPPAAQRGRASRARAPKVTSMEEIEALKKK